MDHVVRNRSLWKGDRAKAVSCKHCGRSFNRRQAPRQRRPADTCSRACYDAMRAFKPYDGPCVVCGGKCEPRTASGRWRRDQRTCSKRCAFRKLKDDLKPRTCKRCGVEYFPVSNGRGKYCSRRCYDVVLAEQGWVVKPCMQCGKDVKRRRQWVRGRVFCGRECAFKFLSGPQSASWRGGASLKRGKGWQRIAEGIRERDKYLCRRCGKTQAENGQRLSVDHVRPWRDRESEEQANDPSNLVSLCRPCHSRKAKLERRWLNGDGLALQEYRRSVGLVA